MPAAARTIAWPSMLPVLAACALCAACETPPRLAAATDSGAWRTLSPSDLVGQGAASQEGEPPAPSESDQREALAKQLSNPVADLTSVPFQANYDGNMGPNETGHKDYVNVQPVVPISIDDDWNLISRTILPLVHQQNLTPGSGTQNGLGDITQSLFLSPVRPTESGVVWGVGPAFLIPTGTDDELGSEKWGVGPTGVVLRQDGPWTYGALANHIWSVAGDEDRPEISNTFLQPFVAYTTREAWTYTLNSESNYDWKDSEWSIPINAQISKVTHIGDQLVSIGGGLRWWVDTPDDAGPEGLGARLFITLLYPRHR